MYKNTSKFRTSRIASAIFLIIGIPLAFFSGLGTIVPLIEGYIPDYFVLPLVMLIGAVVMIIIAIATLRIVNVASYVAWMLEKDSDGIVSVDEILKAKRKSRGSSYERRILKAHSKGYFVKVAYNSTERVFIYGLTEVYGPGIGINCPGCGAPLKIREGSSLVCPTCGAEVKA